MIKIKCRSIAGYMVCLAFLLTAPAGVVFGADFSGTVIYYLVADPETPVVQPGATVELYIYDHWYDFDESSIFTTTTDSNGYFSVSGVPDDYYNALVTATATIDGNPYFGGATYASSGVDVILNSSIAVDETLLPLHPGVVVNGFPNIQSKAMLSKSSFYNSKRNLVRYSTFTYDAQNRLVRKTLRKADKTIMFSEVVDYNDKSKSSRVSTLDGEGKLLRYNETEHDQEGRVSKTSYFDASNALQYYSLSKYDGDRLIKHTIHDKDGTLLHAAIPHRDETGRVVRTVHLDGSGNRQRTIKNKYDAQGRFGGLACYARDDSLIEEWAVSRDQEGRAVMTSFFNSKGLTYYKRVYWNEQDQVSKISLFGTDHRLHAYEKRSYFPAQQ